MREQHSWWRRRAGSQSGKQGSGIRQGCPLSPCLFIALMTVLFFDVHRKLQGQEEEQRVKGAEFDQVLFADDTICIAQDKQVMEDMLKAIEEEGAKYGMKLNKKKCELLAWGTIEQVKMADGTILNKTDTAKYLGCQLNVKADGIKELKARTRDCMAVMAKLDEFWLRGDCTEKHKSTYSTRFLEPSSCTD